MKKGSPRFKLKNTGNKVSEAAGSTPAKLKGAFNSTKGLAVGKLKRSA